MTDFYSQNRCVCSTRSHGPLLCAFCLSFHFKRATLSVIQYIGYSSYRPVFPHISEQYIRIGKTSEQ